jgi:hypothetical protein
MSGGGAPYTIRPASRGEAKPLIGLYAESGAGKTLSALYIARGFAGPTGRVVMIETEAGRGEAYADILPGGYDVVSIRDSFSPENYGLALTAVEKGTPTPRALIIDSASHEWEGAGGVLAMAAKNQAEHKHGPLIWQQPKMEHQRHFMLRLLATPIPLVIVCMRAKYPMLEKPKKDDPTKKEWVRSETLDPKQSDDILFEMFIHGWIDREHKFHATKYTRGDMKNVIVDGEAITIATGERLAAWARESGLSDGRPTGAKAGAGHAHGDAGTSAGGRAPIEKQDDEPRLRPPAPTPKPGTTKVPGVDVEDESQALVKEIEAEKAKLDKQPSDAVWTKLCENVAGTAVLDMADPTALRDLLDLTRKLVARDEGAIARATKIVKGATAEAPA